jgi:hypothetical protein
MPIECRSTTYFIGDPDILSKTCNVQPLLQRGNNLIRRLFTSAKERARVQTERVSIIFESAQKQLRRTNHGDSSLEVAEATSRIYAELDKMASGNAKKLDPSLLGLAVATFDLANEGESSMKPFQVSYLLRHGGGLTSKCMVELPMTYAKKASQKKTSEKSKQHWIRTKSNQLYLIAKCVAGVDENVVSVDNLTSREVVEHIVWQRLGGIVIWDKETMLDVKDCIVLRDLSSAIPLSTNQLFGLLSDLAKLLNWKHFFPAQLKKKSELSSAGRCFPYNTRPWTPKLKKGHTRNAYFILSRTSHCWLSL